MTESGGNFPASSGSRVVRCFGSGHHGLYCPPHCHYLRCGSAGSMRVPWVAILELHGVFERPGGERFREDTPSPQGSGIKVCRRLQCEA